VLAGGAAAEASPPTGAVPGADWAVGVLAGVVADGGALEGADCAHEFVAMAIASANPADTAALETL